MLPDDTLSKSNFLVGRGVLFIKSSWFEEIPITVSTPMPQDADFVSCRAVQAKKV